MHLNRSVIEVVASGQAWDVVCPDGLRRHPTCDNLGSAASSARFASDPHWCRAHSCRGIPCPGGKHRVQVALPAPRSAPRGQA
jgi:hypothetical protein